MKTNDPEHLAMARQREFPFRCDPRLFNDEQHAAIVRWGHWMQALASGRLKPITPAQAAFVTAVNGRNEPTEPYANAWWRYNRRLEIEAKHGAAMHSTWQVDADTFYSREMVKQQRRVTNAANWEAHRN